MTNAQVLMGSDSLPGRALVKIDSGPALLVTLPSAMVLPVVAGDIVAIQGTVSAETVEGPGRHLAANKIALTDMNIPDHLEATGKSAATTQIGVPTVTTVEGIVLNRQQDSFDIDSGDHVYHIQLKNRKEIGIEDLILNWKSPKSQKARIIGIVVSRGKSDTVELDLYPLNPSSIQPMELTASEKLNRAARWSAGIFRGCDICGNTAFQTPTTTK